MFYIPALFTFAKHIFNYKEEGVRNNRQMDTSPEQRLGKPTSLTFHKGSLLNFDYGIYST